MTMIGYLLFRRRSKVEAKLNLPVETVPDEYGRDRSHCCAMAFRLVKQQDW